MRGAGDVSGSSNPGRSPAAVHLRPGEHSDPECSWGGDPTTGSPPKPASSPTGRENGGEGVFFFFFSLFCTLKNQGPVTAWGGGVTPQNAELARFTLLSLFYLPSIHRTPQQASLHWFPVLECPFHLHT